MKLTTIMSIEFLGEVSIYFGIGLQVLMALFLGGMVGYDREKKFKSAGIKTNILICLGATLYTTIGLLVAVGTGTAADPNRIAAQIVSGIGFLGAGAIIQSRGHVTGMTTAATIWVVAAIGFTIGAGYPFTAAFFTTTVLVVLKLLNPVYRLLEKKEEFNYFEIQVLSRGSVKNTVRSIIIHSEHTVDGLIEEEYDKKKDRKILSAYIYAHRRHLDRIITDIQAIIKVEKVAFYVSTEPPSTPAEANSKATDLKVIENA